MAEYPLICTAWEVQALLARRKTQARRAVKPQPGPSIDHAYHCPDGRWNFCLSSGVGGNPVWCPFGVAGDRLWVKETFRASKIKHGRRPAVLYEYLARPETGRVVLFEHDILPALSNKKGWRSPVCMPRCAANLLLERLTNRPPERVQEISSDEYCTDIFAEGVCGICEHPGIRHPDDGPPEHCGGHGGIGCFEDYVDLFRNYWDSRHAKRGDGWALNRWVWVPDFKVVDDA